MRLVAIEEPTRERLQEMAEHFRLASRRIYAETCEEVVRAYDAAPETTPFERDDSSYDVALKSLMFAGAEEGTARDILYQVEMAAVLAASPPEAS